MSNCGMEGLLLFDELFGFDPQESSSFSSERFSIVIGLRSDIERPESFFGVSEWNNLGGFFFEILKVGPNFSFNLCLSRNKKIENNYEILGGMILENNF